VTDAQGQFRIPVRVGAHRLTASLSGFQTVTRTGLQLLLNQTLTVPLQLGPATLTETVTVTGQAPLVDTKESTVGANIDPRQVQDLPINGRNWMDLTLLAPGARRNEGGGLVQNRQGYAQTIVDGQQDHDELSLDAGQRAVADEPRRGGTGRTSRTIPRCTAARSSRSSRA
jgi:hypothetical protein